MKRSLFTKPLKQTLLAVPAAALMLGAAQAGTTVGLNFQAWYYDSGTTPQTVGYGKGYQTTGFPVTTNAFGVATANWNNADPMDCRSAISGYATFGGVNTTFAGGLTANVTAPNAWQSAIGEQVAGFNPETVAPGNNEATWGYLDSNSGQSPAVIVSGLAAKFPHGYVIQTIAAQTGSATFNNVDISDGVNTSTVIYSTYFVSGSASDGYYSGNGTVGLSAPSAAFTSDTININCQTQTSPNRSGLAGFIITDQPVISKDPVGTSLVPGGTISLSATTAALPNALFYQWRTNGVPILGANSATYVKTGATTADSANYDVVVTNLYGSATSAIASVTVAPPVPVTWDANTGSSGAQDGDGTWDSSTTNWWNGTGDVVWNGVNPAIFGAGGSGSYTVNLAANITAAGGLTFNGNYTITNAAGQSITLVGPTGIIANSNATFNVPIAGTDGLTKTGNGTLTLNKQCSYTGNTTVSGGTLSLGVGGSSGTLLGNLTVNSNATVLCGVNNALGYSGNYWVTNINLNFGTLATSVTTDNGWGLIVNMTGATMSTTIPGGYFAMGSSPVVNVTGTTVSSVISADMTVRDDSPGGIVFNVTRGTAATDLKITGSLRASGTGGITLNGGGITQLSGTNTYSGGTTVNGGTLTVSGQLTGDGAITMADNTMLNVTAAGVTPAINLPSASMTVGDGTGPNALGFAGLSSTNVAPISLGSGLIYGNNPIAIKILSLNPVVGSYPLIYAAGGAYITTGSLTLPSGYTGSLSNYVDGVTGSSTLYVNITGVPTVPVSIVTDLSGTTDQRYAGATYTLSVVTYGTSPITYLWTHNGTSVGSNSPTLVLTDLTGTDVGAYTVKVSNSLNSVQSATNQLVLVQPPGYDALVMAASPVSYWPLAETSGFTAFDIYGYNNASYSGTYTLNAATNPQTGIAGAHFDGASGIALTPYVPALNPDVFTAEAWVNPDNVPASEYCPLSCGQFASAGRSGWLIYQLPGYWDLRTYCNNGTTLAAEAIGTSAPVIGAWTHLAVSWDGTNASLYVNGQLQASSISSTIPAYVPGASGGFCAGARADSAFFFPGTVSGAALYNRVLTPAEILSHASYTAPTAPSNITITRSGANLVLSWTSGSLQAAPEVTGTYTNVPAATSPYTVAPTEARKFFRLVN